MNNVTLGILVLWFLTVCAWYVDRKLRCAEAQTRCDECRLTAELRREVARLTKLCRAQSNQLNSQDAHLRIIEQRKFSSFTKDE